MKELNEQTEKYKLLEEQQKLLKKQNEQDKILKQQNDELNKLLEQQKQEEEEENMLRDTLNELDRNFYKIKEGIDSLTSTKFRTFAPKRDIKKPTPSSSKTPAPITKSHEPQGVAVGEQAGASIMENKLEASKNYTEYLKKELKNTDFLSKKALEINDKIIKEEDEVRKLEKKIRERKEDIERRFRKYYPDKYYSYKK